MVDPSSVAEGDASVDFKTKGAGFEGMVTGMKRAVIHAESQVIKTCFKQRGKYTEAECKKSVESAFERMANDIWRQLGGYLQKSVNTRAADTLRSLIKLQSDADSIAAQVKELQVHFEDSLRRQVHLSSFTPDARLHTSLSVEDDEKMSEASDLSRISVSARDMSSDLKEQGNRLLQSFQRFTSSGGTTETGTVPSRREMDLVLRDMLMMVRSSKAEASRAREDKGDQRLERHLARIRNRIDTLCRSFEEGASTKRMTLNVTPPPNETMTVSSEDIRSLREVIAHQAAEIEKLRRDSLLSGRVSSPIEPVHEDLQQMNETQGSIMADIREMKKHMDRVFFASKDTGGASATQALLVLKASAPHIQADNDTEFVKKLMSEVLSIRKSQHMLLQLLRKDGITVETLEDVGTEYSKLRKEWVETKEHYDELFLRMIKIQSESELESNYHQSKIKELEAELELVRNGRNTPDSGSSRAKRSVEIKSNPLDEENTVLSTENFALLQKLETAAKEKMQMLRMLEDAKMERRRKEDVEETEEPEIVGNLEAVLSSLPPFPGRRSPFHQSAPPSNSKEPIKIISDLEA